MNVKNLLIFFCCTGLFYGFSQPEEMTPNQKYCSHFEVGDTIYAYHQDQKKTGVIVSKENCETEVEFFGKWHGKYSVMLNRSIAPYKSKEWYCSLFTAGDKVYTYHREQMKTAKIISIEGCTAEVEYYGDWSGDYSIALNNSVTFQKIADTIQTAEEKHCESFYVGEKVYAYHSGQEKTAKIVSKNGCAAELSFYGKWMGTYTIELNKSIASQSLTEKSKTKKEKKTPLTPLQEYCSKFTFGDTVYAYHDGQKKTARILSKDGCQAELEFFGDWYGNYTVTLNHTIVPANVGSEYCSMFEAGDKVFTFHQKQKKTARIISLEGCQAKVEYYGKWYGEYSITINNNVFFQKVADHALTGHEKYCELFDIGDEVYAYHSDQKKTAKITKINGCDIELTFSGSWSGVYSSTLNHSIVPRNEKASFFTSFKPGDKIYTFHSNQMKTAVIKSINGTKAEVEYYGKWFGTYTIELNHNVRLQSL